MEYLVQQFTLENGTALLDIKESCQDIRKTGAVVLIGCIAPHTCLEPGDKMILILMEKQQQKKKSLNNDDELTLKASAPIITITHQAAGKGVM